MSGLLTLAMISFQRFLFRFESFLFGQQLIALRKKFLVRVKRRFGAIHPGETRHCKL
jgi:hypothetical protein